MCNPSAAARQCRDRRQRATLKSQPAHPAEGTSMQQYEPTYHTPDETPRLAAMADAFERAVQSQPSTPRTSRQKAITNMSSTATPPPSQTLPVIHRQLAAAEYRYGVQQSARVR